MKHIKISFLLLLLFITQFSQAQTFTNGLVATGNGSSNMFCDSEIGPDGKVYVLWKFGSFISNTNQLIPYFQIRKWDATTSTWSTVGGFTTTDIPNQYSAVQGYTMFGDRVGLEIDATGNYHVAIQNYTTTDGGTTIKAAVTYCKSTNGTNWTFTVLQDNNATVNVSYSDVQLELDNNDSPHVTFKINDASSSTVANRKHYIRHFTFNGTSWSGENALVSSGAATSMNEITSYAYTIDKNGKSHIAASLESNGSGTDGSLVYFNNVSGTWSTPTFLITGATGAAASVTQDIITDGNAKVHIISRALSYAISYTTNASGSFVSKSLGISGNFDFQSLAINASNELFSFYNQHTGTNAGVVQYAYLASGATTWATGNVMTGNNRTGQYTSVEFTDGHVAMMFFDHFTGTGSPSYGPPNNPRQLQYATASFAPAATVATLTTNAISTFAQTTATLGGNISADGGATVTERGVVYSLSPTPTTANTKVQIGSGTGSFSQSVTGLTAATKYYVRAYAINSVGTAYGAEVNFTTLNTPKITVSSTLNSFSTCATNASTTQLFNVSGTFLTNHIVLTAPTGYEIAQTSNGLFVATLILTQTGGNVASTNIYVRLAASATGTPAGNITVASINAVTENVAVTGTVKPKTTGTLNLTACDKIIVNAQTYTTSGTYTQTLTNKAGCDSVLTLNLTVKSLPSGKTTINGATISANLVGATYKWFECSTPNTILETTQSFAPTATGNYGVVITSNGCDTTSLCKLVTVTVTDVNDSKISGNTIAIYPNPASSILHVSLPNQSIGTLSLSDVNGKLVLTETIQSNNTEINTSTLANGVYFLKVTTETINTIQKIMVIK